MNHPTLYKRTKTGAIQFYEVRVTTNSIWPIIEKKSGQLGTLSPIVHCEDVKTGKNIGRANETSPREQAELQAASDWKRKLDDGYKSLADLGIVQREGFYTFDSPTVQHTGQLDYVLDKVLPQFNTDASGNVKPMLATDWKKIKTIDYSVYAQPKLDGIRCLMVIVTEMDANLAHHRVTFLSRAGKEFTTLNHIKADVASWLLSQPMEDRTLILDGELYSDELTFQEITQAVKKLYPNTGKIHFRAYDVVSDDAWDVRMIEAEDLVRDMDSPHIHWVETHLIHDAATVKQLHDGWVQEGYEGAMIRLPKGRYAQGQRSRELLKVKEFNEDEFTIVGGKLYKVPLPPVGAMECSDRDADSFTFTCVTATGSEFDVKPMGTRQERGDYVLNLSHYIGRKYTVKYFGFTDDGLPRIATGRAVRDYE